VLSAAIFDTFRIVRFRNCWRSGPWSSITRRSGEGYSRICRNWRNELDRKLQVRVSEVPGWAKPQLWPFILLSAIGLGLSLWVHLGAVAGRTVVVAKAGETMTPRMLGLHLSCLLPISPQLCRTFFPKPGLASPLPQRSSVRCDDLPAIFPQLRPAYYRCLSTGSYTGIYRGRAHPSGGIELSAVERN
jgi:hypothetical protein